MEPKKQPTRHCGGAQTHPDTRAKLDTGHGAEETQKVAETIATSDN